MNEVNNAEAEDFDITIGPNDGNAKSKEEKAEAAEFVKQININRTPDRIRRNKMLSVLYRIEEYLQDQTLQYDDLCTIEYFVREFLKVLGLNKSQFAKYIDSDISNLNKYYKGQRAFNTELAMKFGHFFHTPVDVWLRVQLKNDLLELQKEKETEEKYRKYDYEKLEIA